MRLQVGEFNASTGGVYIYVCVFVYAFVSAKCPDDKRWLRLISGVKCYRPWPSLGPDPGTIAFLGVATGCKFITFECPPIAACYCFICLNLNSFVQQSRSLKYIKVIGLFKCPSLSIYFNNTN